MFNLGPGELIVIGIAALLLFGPKRLPELAKSMGKGIRDFKKALSGEGEEEKPQQLPPTQSASNTVPQSKQSDPVSQNKSNPTE